MTSSNYDDVIISSRPPSFTIEIVRVFLNAVLELGGERSVGSSKLLYLQK